MKITEEEAQTMPEPIRQQLFGGNKAAKVPSKPVKRKRAGNTPVGEMNVTESIYGKDLKAQLLAGEIIWYLFEAVKFPIASRCSYNPDFLVMTPTHVKVVEIKGGGPIMDDSIVKFKVAASKWPWMEWIMLQRISKTKTKPAEWKVKYHYPAVGQG